jgi:hypothetical protein
MRARDERRATTVYCSTGDEILRLDQNDIQGDDMPLPVATGAPTLFIRRPAYEKSGLSRAALDERLGLTADEFRVEGNLIAIGPIFGASEGDALGDLIAELESLGLVYFDDFFELTGNWPEWLNLVAISA